MLKAEAALCTLDRVLATRKFLASDQAITLADIQICKTPHPLWMRSPLIAERSEQQVP